MHILIFPSEEFVPKNNHLLGIFQSDQAKILKKAGHEVGVISVNLKYSLPMLCKSFLFKLIGKKVNNDTDQYSMSELIGLTLRKLFAPSSFLTIEDYHGIPVYRGEGFYLLPPNQKFDYLWWRKVGIRVFNKYVKDKGLPDLMHVHIALNAGITAAAIKDKYNIPYWITERISFFARGLYHPNLLPKARDAYNRADKVFTVSRFLGEGLKRIYPDFKYEVFPNTVDPIVENTPLSPTKDQSFTFLSVSSLIPLKNNDLIILAFHNAFAAGDDVQLRIIGDGVEEEDLRQLIRDLNESDRITLLGRKSKKEIVDELDKSHCLCHFSDYETFGVAVLEAQFRGLPVVATKCGGPEEIISQGTGILVEKGDIAGMAATLASIRKNIKNFDSNQIREYAIQKFGSQAFLKRIESYCKETKNFTNTNT